MCSSDLGDGHGTHLGTTLKELKSLGISGLSLSGHAGDNLEIGTGLGLGESFDALTGGLPTFTGGTHVTLDTTLGELAGANNLGADATALHNAGITDVRIEPAANQSLTDLLGGNNNALVGDIHALQYGADGKATGNDGLHVTLDLSHTPGMAAGHLGEVTLSGGDLGGISLGVGGDGHGTHLGTTLKELKSLGISGLSLSGHAGDNLEIGTGLGLGESFDALTGGLPTDRKSHV